MTSVFNAARPKLVFGLVFILAIGLSGCSKRNAADDYGQLAPSLDSNDEQGRFGSRFEQSLHADPNSEPMDIGTNDVAPVDPTKEPVEVQ